MSRKATMAVQRESPDDLPLHDKLVPQKLSVQSLGLDGDPDMFAELRIHNGQVECTSITWRAQEAGRGVTTSDIHEIPDLTEFAVSAFLRYPRAIDDFRRNGGKLGGQFEGAPLLLLHHHEPETRKEYVAIIFYMSADDDPDSVYVFATRAGRTENPTWYYNVTKAGAAEVEVGMSRYPVEVRELHGEERDRVWAEQVKRYPGFGEYERLNKGVRVIPVVELKRISKADHRRA